MKHKIVPENCEFLLDSENRIYGISFKLTERKSETYYIAKDNFLKSMKEIWLEELFESPKFIKIPRHLGFGPDTSRKISHRYLY